MTDNSIWQTQGFAYLDGGYTWYGDPLLTMPEEIQEQVNAHQDAFRSEEDIRHYVEYLRRHS